MASSTNQTSRDWGRVGKELFFYSLRSIYDLYLHAPKAFFYEGHCIMNFSALQGMACVGRQKVCNVVPPNHFGPIPGVEVGTMWKFRVQVCISLVLHNIAEYASFL